MEEKKVSNLKEVKLEVKPKGNKNKEVIYPFVEQIIDKYLNRPDPRITKDSEWILIDDLD